MPPFLQFLIRRLFAALVSAIVITMVLFAGAMLAPPEERAKIYMPTVKGEVFSTEKMIENVIRKYHMDEPYLVQYVYWVRSLFDGTWGYSPNLNGNVMPTLIRRTPATLEIAFYSLLLLIPLGLASGLYSGWKPGSRLDGWFRAGAYLGTSMPPFIFSMFALAVFYVRLSWFAPGRLDPTTEYQLTKTAFQAYTGALTLDALLNGRFDIFLKALQHLAMPVMTLAMFHWATLGRVTRATVLNERRKEYIIAARARGVNERTLLWRHALRPILAPSLTTMALSAASIVTGVYVVEIIFGIAGLSNVIVASMQTTAPDAAAALGFAVYSVLMVIGLMLVMDLIQAVLDPRVRDEVLKS
ncbi:MAG TPA: ABC transporter permease [Anaerolineales bacterium]